MGYPGYGATVTNTPSAILASSEGVIVEPITVKSGQGVLAIGTLVARDTVTGKYVAYNNGGSYGADVAMGVLADKVDATSSDKLVAMYVRAYFVVGKLVGYDAAALVDLNGRRVGSGSASTDKILI